MGLVTFDFLALLALGAVLYRFVPRRARAAFLVAASYLFYATWNPGMLLALFASTAVVFAAGRWIEAWRERPAVSRLVAIAVGVLVAYLAVFKIAEAMRLGGGFVIPLGISYYTFKLISYLIDVYWATGPAETDFLCFAAYVAFFPQIVAGPIQRGSDFLPQMHRAPLATAPMILSGITRIVLGCFKKLAVADTLALLVNYGFNHATGTAGLPRLMAFYVFPLQLFADFSALTDIAIGAARLFGLESPENFDAPYSAASISEYWRRWHMTLTHWLRDYVFTPLRMRLRNWGNAGLAVSLTVNMVLIGLWHGLTLPFLVFGLIHSVYLVVDALPAQSRKKLYRKRRWLSLVTDWIGPVVTYHLVAIGDVFFRARSFADGFAIVARLYSGVTVEFGTVVSAIQAGAWIGLGGYALVEVLEYIRRRQPELRVAAAPRWIRWSAVSCALVVAVFFLAVLLARKSAVNPFVYAIF
jgi:D-alanyl-lipoteichoic acid acyltransferase DltB (MBOAT superfamily)